MPYEKFEPQVISSPIASRTAGPGGDVQRLAAQELAGLAQTVGAMADHAAAVDGAKRGALAGMDPEFRPTGEHTLRGEAYDQAALRSHAQMLDGKIRSELATLYDATKHDPDAFAAGARDIYQNRIGNLPAEIQPDLAASFERQTFTYTRDLARTHEATVLSEQAASLNALMATRTADYGRMAYTLGLDTTADERLSAEGEDILGNLLQYGPKQAFSYGGKDFAADDTRAGLLTPEAISQQMIALGDEVAVNRIKGAFDRTKGLAGQQKFMKAFQEQWAAGEGVAKSMTLPASEKLTNWMDAKIRDGLAEQRAAASAIRAEISDIHGQLRDYQSGVKDGLMPPPGVVDGFMARARATGDPAIVREVQSLAGLVELGSAAAKASPMELQQKINEGRALLGKTGATPEQAARVDLLENTLTGMTTALAKDPLSWGARAGVVDVQPLAFAADPETGLITMDPASLAARRTAAQRMSAQYGVPFKPFTDEEGALAVTIEKQGGENMLGLAKSIVTSFGSDAPSALAQLSDKAPALAHLGGLMAQGSDMGALRAATLGFKMLEEAKGVSDGIPKGVSKDPFAIASAATINRAFAGTLSELPELRGQIERTADAIYVGRRGLNSPWDPLQYGRAIQEAAGASFVNGTVYGGISSGMMVPGWMKSGAIDDVMGSLDVGDYAMGGVNGRPVDAEGKPLSREQLRQAQPVSIGPGLFQLRLPNEGGAAVRAKTAHGDEPYVLDLNQLRVPKSLEWQEYTR